MTLADVETEFARRSPRSWTASRRSARSRPVEHGAAGLRTIARAAVDGAGRAVIVIKLGPHAQHAHAWTHLRPTTRRRIALETHTRSTPRSHTASDGADALGARGPGIQASRARELSRAGDQGRRAQESAGAADRGPARAPRGPSCRNSGIPCEVGGPAEALWSIHRKMQQRGKEYDEIYDLMAIHVVTDSCQLLSRLGIIHTSGPDAGAIPRLIALHQVSTCTGRCTRPSSDRAGACTRSRSGRRRCIARRNTASR